MISYLIIGLFVSLALNGGDEVSARPAITAGTLDESVGALYHSLELNDFPRPDSLMFQIGARGYQNLKAANMLRGKEVITLVDFSKPSSEKRMWVIDLKEKTVLYHLLVAHGKNSGELYATRFSNELNSFQSSLGLFVTGETYYGKNGTSLRLYGMQKELNGLAEKRSIVMHGADYVSEAFVSRVGRLGRSYGCPAIPMTMHKEVINLLAGGTVLLLYTPGANIQTTFTSQILARSN